MKAKKIIYFVCSFIAFAILGCMAYIGLWGLIPSLPMPDFFDNFEVFYKIFYGFNLVSIIFTLPLLIAVTYSIIQFSEKNWKMIFLILEIAFLVIIFLHGFGAF